MEEFKYLGTNLTYQNSIQEEIKSRLKSGNACYHSVQNLLSSNLLSLNLKIKINKAIILPVVLCGCCWGFVIKHKALLHLTLLTDNKNMDPWSEITEWILRQR